MNKENLLERTKKWSPAAVSLLLALIYSLFIYYFNTPIGASIGSDNSIYLTMGTALARGYAPYLEIFDHKGPMLFILQTIPQAIAGGYSLTAVFAMEVLFLFACLHVCQRIADHFQSPSLAVQLVYLALTAPLIFGGNLSEEYTNLFTLVGILAALRVFDRDEPQAGRRLAAPAALMGAMSMLCFLTRANNALPLCAMTLVLAGGLLMRRRFADFFICAGGFMAGMLLCALPVALWLAAHGALDAAFYGSIIHNLMYAETDGSSRIGMLINSDYGHMALLIAGIACAGALPLIRRRPALALSMIAGAAAAGLAAFISHKFYNHYLMIGVPMAAAGAAALLGAAKRRLCARCTGKLVPSVMLLCCVWLCASGYSANSIRRSEIRNLDAFVSDAQALYAQVPEEDRDDFFAYRVEPKWYVASGALPCMRFYFLQEILAQADPAVMDEIVETFHTDPPEWLVIFYNREFGPPYDERVAEIFETRYSFVDARGEYQLRRLIR